MMVKIRIAGVGGQGLKFLGKILGIAAIDEGLFAAESSTYTPVTRGGAIHSDIIISNKKILYPFVDKATIFCALANIGLEKHIEVITEKTEVILNSDIVKNGPNFPSKTIERVPLTTLALEAGSPHVLNMVLLGHLIHSLELDTEALRKAIQECPYEVFEAYESELLELNPIVFQRVIEKVSPERFVEMNLKSFNLGYSWVNRDA